MSRKLSIIFLITITTFLIVGCDDNGTGGGAGLPEAVPGVATDIVLTVYPIGIFEPAFEVFMEEEGEITIDPGNSQQSWHYNVYARADNFYTELFDCNSSSPVLVDLDSVAGPHRTMTGTIFAVQGSWSDSYFADKTMTLYGPNKLSRTVTTDDQGRYSIGALPLGDYRLESDEYFGSEYSPTLIGELRNTLAMDYKDISFLEPWQVDAPNIYLYPETKSDVSVTLDFPNDGYVNVSDPPYNDGWNVSVTPEGLIDGEYGYLFYKAILPTQPNTNEGWLLTTANLESEFRTILAEQGFIGREIDDFVEHWVPIFDDAPYYGMFPQDVETFVELNVSPQPESTLRVFYLIIPFDQPVTIPIPRDHDYFIRDGFTVVEWGVFASNLD